MKRLNSFLYTKGKFGKGCIRSVDTNNEYLYSKAMYKTKIKKEDLPDDYIEFRSGTIRYMTGYLKTSGVVDIDYTYFLENHIFKDDYLYISYKEKLKKKKHHMEENTLLIMMSVSVVMILYLSYLLSKRILISI